MAGSKKLTIAATEAGGHYGNLGLPLVWGPEGALLVVEVLRAMEDDCVVGGEGGGRHVCERERRAGWEGGLRKKVARTGWDFIRGGGRSLVRSAFSTVCGLERGGPGPTARAASTA